MGEKPIAALNIAFNAVAPDAYIKAIDDNDFVLDGHFTFQQLQAICLHIQVAQLGAF